MVDWMSSHAWVLVVMVMPALAQAIVVVIRALARGTVGRRPGRGGLADGGARVQLRGPYRRIGRWTGALAWLAHASWMALAGMAVAIAISCGGLVSWTAAAVAALVLLWHGEVARRTGASPGERGSGPDDDESVDLAWEATASEDPAELATVEDGGPYRGGSRAPAPVYVEHANRVVGITIRRYASIEAAVARVCSDTHLPRAVVRQAIRPPDPGCARRDEESWRVRLGWDCWHVVSLEEARRRFGASSGVVLAMERGDEVPEDAVAHASDPDDGDAGAAGA